jgi:hypothetical protein
MEFDEKEVSDLANALFEDAVKVSSYCIWLQWNLNPPSVLKYQINLDILYIVYEILIMLAVIFIISNNFPHDQDLDPYALKCRIRIHKRLSKI